MEKPGELQIRHVGNVHLPKAFAHLIWNNPPIKIFNHKELSQLDNIFGHIRKGGLSIVCGPWEKVLQVLSYLQKKKREFSSIGNRRKLLMEEFQYTRPWYERHYQEVLSRLMVIIQDDHILDIDLSSRNFGEVMQIPYLIELLGEFADTKDNNLPFLVPVIAIQEIQNDLRQKTHNALLGIDIVKHNNVLSPISQDTIELFYEALQKVSYQLTSPLEILDMGCGSGILSLLAAKVFAFSETKITATDILPEAMAITKINVEQNLRNLAGKLVNIETTKGGDLFQPVGDCRFHLIMFNPPWVIARPRSRAEIAIYDENQNTIQRFLSDATEHLKKDGHIILSYSNHSGTEVIEKLRIYFEKSNFKIENIYKRRIQSRQSRQKWETIFVFDIKAADRD